MIGDISKSSEEHINLNIDSLQQDFNDAIVKVNDVINKKLKRVRASHEAKYPKGVDQDQKLVIDMDAIDDLMNAVKNQIQEMIYVTSEDHYRSTIMNSVIRHTDIAVINTVDWQKLLKGFQELTTIMIQTINRLKEDERHRKGKKSSRG